MASRKIVKSKRFFEENIEEYIGEVSTESWSSWKKKEDFKFVGKPIPRIDGYDKVSGTARYAFDIIYPNMVYAKTLRCPLPNARIKSINTEKAAQLEGVLDIITYQNTPEIEWYRHSFLFDPHLRYEGDEVACVAARSEMIAEKALKLIEVEYEELPFVLDTAEAMKEDSPKLHKEGNILGGEASTYSRGDVEKGFQEADMVVEDTFTTQVEIHNPTEPHCSVVNWDGKNLTVWDSTQAIFNVRGKVAESLQIPESKVRVIKKFMGGGFGSKLEAGKYTVMAAILARNIGRPVRISLDRKEMNLAVGNRPDSVQKLKAGAKKDGTLTAMSHHSRGAAGAYAAGTGCSWPLRSIYKCPNIKTEDYSVFINAGRARPFRAPGHVQGTFGLESLLDELAEKIGMDPLEFRLKNYAEKDQVNDMPYSSKLLREAYQKGSEAFGWKKKWRPAGSDKGPIRRGVGLASQIWWGAGGPPTYVTMELNEDGSIQLQCGTQDIGGGTYTFMAQVAAEVMEVPMENIQVILGDTSTCPFGPSSGGSQTAPSVSPAVRDAGERMKVKLMSGAAALLEIPEDQLTYSGGVISVKNNPEKQIKIAEIVRKLDKGVMVVTGARNENEEGYAMQSFGVQFAEVEVDTYTGKVKVLRITAAHDIGKTLNRQMMENQFHGGIIQGLGYALMEERVMNAYTGKVVTTNLHDYKIPTMKDTPEIDIIIVSDGDFIISSTGVKGIGEPAMIPTPGAIGNAVYNALGVRIKSLPITPDKVLMALNS